MSESLNNIARRYFYAKLGGGLPEERLTGLQRRYWLSLSGGDHNTGFQSLEKDWLHGILLLNEFNCRDRHGISCH